MLSRGFLVGCVLWGCRIKDKTLGLLGVGVGGCSTLGKHLNRWRSGDNLWESLLSFHQMDARN